MKSSYLLLAFCFLTGCSTAPVSPEAEATRRERQERTRAQNEERHAQEDLRRRYERYTTDELLIMRSRYADLAQLTTSKDLGLKPAASRIWGNSDLHNAEKLIEIERELL